MKTFIARLIERRVPQYMLVYIGVAWGLMQFTDFVVDNFLLSPHWTRIVFLAMLMLWPGYLLVIYRHGRPGVDSWGTPEKLGVPANLLLAVAALFFMFRGEDLGAATTSVTVADESGNLVEREIAKPEFRKRTVLFDFDSSGLADDDLWLTGFIPDAVSMDLAGNDFFDSLGPSRYIETLRRLGHATSRDVPLALKREIADDLHADWIFSGTVGRSGEGFTATVALHRAAGGNPVSEDSYTAGDLFALVDLISADLRKHLEIPDRADAPDLPIEEAYTSNTNAVAPFGRARNLLVLDNDYSAAIALLQQAVAADPTFALAQNLLAGHLLQANRTAEAIVPMQAALNNVYRLPERLQFIVKSNYFFAIEDFERSMAVIDMWAELYPEDIAALANLRAVQDMRNERVEAIATLEKIYALDPGQADLLKQIAQRHSALGNFDEARTALQRYIELFPEDYTGPQSLAGIETNAGDLGAARRALDLALLHEPGNTELLLMSATLDQRIGNFSEAEAGLRDALDSASSPRAKANVLGALQNYYWIRGQISTALDVKRQRIEEAASYLPSLQVATLHINSLDVYLDSGREAEARAILDEHGAQLTPPADAVVAVARLRLAIDLRDITTAETGLALVEAMIAANQIEALRGTVLTARAQIEGLKGNWEGALRLREEFLEANPTDPLVHTAMAECLRELGRLPEAEEAVRRTIQNIPGSAQAYVELARVLDARGDHAGARAALDQALEFWSLAEPDYEPAAEARALREMLITG